MNDAKKDNKKKNNEERASIEKHTPQYGHSNPKYRTETNYKNNERCACK